MNLLWLGKRHRCQYQMKRLRLWHPPWGETSLGSLNTATVVAPKSTHVRASCKALNYAISAESIGFSSLPQAALRVSWPWRTNLALHLQTPVKDFLKNWENTWLFFPVKCSSTAADCSSKHSSKWPIRGTMGDRRLDIITADTGAASCGRGMIHKQPKVVTVLVIFHQ